MDAKQRLSELSRSTGYQPFVSCRPGCWTLYEHVGRTRLGEQEPTFTHHSSMYYSDGQFRAEVYGRWPSTRPDRVWVAGKKDSFALDPPSSVPPGTKPEDIHLEVKGLVATGQDGEDISKFIITSEARPLVATHHGPHPYFSAFELMDIIATNRDGNWTLNVVKDVTREGEPCVYVEATQSKNGVSKWWFDKSHGNVLVAAEMENTPGKFAYRQEATFDFIDPARPVCTKLVLTEIRFGKPTREDTYTLVEAKPWAEVPGWFEAKSFGITDRHSKEVVVPGISQSRYGDWPLWLGLLLVAVLLTAAGLYLRRRSRR